MQRVLFELFDAVREAGVPCGTAEVIDAERAAMAVGFGDKADLRAALGCTLCKRPEERAAFDRVFDAFFRVDAGGRRGALDRLRAEGLSQDELSAIAGQLAAGTGAGGGGGLELLLAAGGELDERVERAVREAGIERISHDMQVGFFAVRALRALGIEEAEAALAEGRARFDPRLVQALAAQAEALRRRVRGRVRSELDRRRPTRLARSRAERLEQTPFVALDRDEVADVRRAVEQLGQQLRDRHSRRPRRARRGRLDARATLRRARRTGGVAFRCVQRRRRRERPELVVICDISGSVSAAARFFLVLVHAMQEVFSRTRSFVFVQKVQEVSDLFAGRSVEAALGEVFGGPGIAVGGSSDYGRVWGELLQAHRPAFGRRTTVVVLGDARNNHLASNLPALAQLRSQTRRLIWLNPEPRASWGMGDSEMLRYGELCDFVASVRNLAELRTAVHRVTDVRRS